MKKLFLFGLILGLLLMLTSCATILDEGETGVIINSEPSGATVKVDGFEMGKTPVVLYIDNVTPHMVEISKEGYLTESVHLTKHLKWGWQALDLVTAPLTGNIIDMLSPRGYKLKPDKISVNLTELK